MTICQMELVSAQPVCNGRTGGKGHHNSHADQDQQCHDAPAVDCPPPTAKNTSVIARDKRHFCTPFENDFDRKTTGQT